jgi:hypothetical protein
MRDFALNATSQVRAFSSQVRAFPAIISSQVRAFLQPPSANRPFFELLAFILAKLESFPAEPYR